MYAVYYTFLWPFETLLWSVVLCLLVPHVCIQYPIYTPPAVGYSWQLAEGGFFLFTVLASFGNAFYCMFYNTQKVPGHREELLYYTGTRKKNETFFGPPRKALFRGSINQPPHSSWTPGVFYKYFYTTPIVPALKNCYI